MAWDSTNEMGVLSDIVMIVFTDRLPSLKDVHQLSTCYNY